MGRCKYQDPATCPSQHVPALFSYTAQQHNDGQDNVSDLIASEIRGVVRLLAIAGTENCSAPIVTTTKLITTSLGSDDI